MLKFTVQAKTSQNKLGSNNQLYWMLYKTYFSN